MKRWCVGLLLLIGVSFIFQLVWEFSICQFFYRTDNNTNSLMWSATFGDVMMTVVLYALLIHVNKDFHWLERHWERHDYMIMILYGLFLSFYFEINALKTGRWNYTELMPVVPGTNVGVMPVIQLILLFPLTFFMARSMIRWINRKSN